METKDKTQKTFEEIFAEADRRYALPQEQVRRRSKPNGVIIESRRYIWRTK